MKALQAVVGDPDGLQLRSLINAIEAGYRTVNGGRVRVVVGQGQAIDGLSPGFLFLVELPLEATSHE